MNRIQKPAYSFSAIAIGVIVCVSIGWICFFRWDGDSSKYIVDGDGRDYYSYLISVFINKNLGNQDAASGSVIATPTGTINLHTVGVSLLLLPFFGMGYIWALFSNAELNGVDVPFQKMVSIGALFYLILGLFYLKRLLFDFGIKDKVIAIVLLLIFFGTNLLNYALQEPSMSHVYSFALICAFLFFVGKLFRQFSKNYLYISSVILGLIILVRPVNVIILLAIPVLANSFYDLEATALRIFNNKKYFVISILINLLLLSIQSVIWYIQNEHFVQWSYKGNGFYFAHPEILLMLFGFNSGFFIYTPLCLVALIGFVPLFFQNKFRFCALIFFLGGCFYLFASYWGYTYFDGLSIRTLVDFYALFAILLAGLLSYIAHKKIKYLVMVLLVAASYLNLIYCYQYQAGILSPAGMNFKKFRYIFLKIDKVYVGSLGGCMDLPLYSKKAPKTVGHYAHQEPYSFDQNEFGLDFNIQPLRISFNRPYVQIRLERKEEFSNSSSGALIVVSIESGKGVSKNYSAHKLNDVPSENCCEWEDAAYCISVGTPLLPGDKLSIYIWNKDKQPFSVKNYEVSVYDYGT